MESWLKTGPKTGFYPRCLYTSRLKTNQQIRAVVRPGMNCASQSCRILFRNIKRSYNKNLGHRTSPCSLWRSLQGAIAREPFSNSFCIKSGFLHPLNSRPSLAMRLPRESHGPRWIAASRATGKAFHSSHKLTIHSEWVVPFGSCALANGSLSRAVTCPKHQVSAQDPRNPHRFKRINDPPARTAEPRVAKAASYHSETFQGDSPSLKGNPSEMGRPSNRTPCSERHASCSEHSTPCSEPDLTFMAKASSHSETRPQDSPPHPTPCSELDLKFMALALGEARLAAAAGEVPVGAVMVMGGTVLASARNRSDQGNDPTAHAEMLCIREAARKAGDWRNLKDATLYVTLEPCPMCAGAILQARIGCVVWGAPNKLLGADGSWISLLSTGVQRPSLPKPSGKRARDHSMKEKGMQEHSDKVKGAQDHSEGDRGMQDDSGKETEHKSSRNNSLMRTNFGRSQEEGQPSAPETERSESVVPPNPLHHNMVEGDGRVTEPNCCGQVSMLEPGELDQVNLTGPQHPFQHPQHPFQHPQHPFQRSLEIRKFVMQEECSQVMLEFFRRRRKDKAQDQKHQKTPDEQSAWNGIKTVTEMISIWLKRMR